MYSLRVIKSKKEILLLCPNGSIAKVDSDILVRLLTDFTNPKSFKGKYGTWNNLYAEMENYPGETLAFVERERLIVKDNKLFANLKAETEYISAQEYADMHGKSKPMIKTLCQKGRIEGVIKHSTGWLIPKNAPYPKRKIRECKPNDE